MADTRDMFLETEISRPAEYISRLIKLISRLTMLTIKKQRVNNFSGQRLVDYIKCEVNYMMYKSTNRLMMCVFQGF